MKSYSSNGQTVWVGFHDDLSRVIYDPSQQYTEDREPTPISPAANVSVAEGSGDFERVYEVKHIGCLHLAFSGLPSGSPPRERSFGTVY